MYRSLALIFMLFVQTAISAQADTCEPRAEVCSQKAATSLSGGFQIARTCLEKELSETCTDPDPEDTCRALSESSACEQVSSTCIAMNSGECDRKRKRFECLNANEDVAPAQLVERKFEGFQEDVADTCEDLESNPKCLLTDTRTTDPGGTKDINGLDVTRPWWQKQRDFTCISGKSENTCAPYESDPICRIMDASCLSSTSDGVCVQVEFRYKCGVGGDVDTSCRRVDVCVAGNCDGFEEPSNEDFPKAAAWLNVLDEMTRDVDPDQDATPEDVVFFGGDISACRQTAFGYRNCCELKGWIANGECHESEHDLYAGRQAGAAHYVGSYCSVYVLFFCTAHKRTYCRFGSKFARVFQEQAREQLGWSWGTPQAPECQGLTIADLDQVDLEAFDLSEIFGDMLEDAERPDAAEIMALLRRNLSLAPRDARDLYE